MTNDESKLNINAFQNLIESKDPDELTELFESSRRLMSYYRCAMLEIETKFRVLNEELAFSKERNPIESIKSRLKSFESIRGKLIRRGYPLTLESVEENLSDVAGVRVICSFLEDIYMLADCLLKQDDVKLITLKDYIKNPKSNGYRSMHLIVEIPIFLCNAKKHVKVEVQLRTIAMESWANLEHRLRYKKDIDDVLRGVVDSELNDCAILSNKLDLKMQRLRELVYDDPRGSN